MAVSDITKTPYLGFVYELVELVKSAPNHADAIRQEYSKKISEISKAEEKKRVESFISRTIGLLYGEDSGVRRIETSKLALIKGALDDTELTATDRHKAVCLLIKAYEELYNGEIPYTAL